MSTVVSYLKPKLSLLNPLSMLLAFLSVWVVSKLILFLGIDDSELSVPVNEFLSRFADLDLVWLLSSADFASSTDLSLVNLLANASMFGDAYSALSLSIFCIGLLIYHRFMVRLPLRYFGSLLLIMGWMHLLVAKLVLMVGLPTLLTGPVIAIGLIPVLYFSVTCFLVELIYLVKAGKRR